jgi:Domain of unknown function (DUF6748)
MTGRRLIAAPLLLASVVGLACLFTTIDARGASPAAAVYRLKADSRLCPSPVCGGFWARRVNRTLTTCLDGSTQASCYIAAVDLSALSTASRARAQAALPSSTTLATGTFARYRSDDFPQLARLAAARVWVAAGPSRDTATVYRVVDTGLRCVRAPCFSLRATAVNRTTSASLSSIDLSGSGASAAELRRAHAALSSTGILATGATRADEKPGTDAGRVLAATQLWLPA